MRLSTSDSFSHRFHCVVHKVAKQHVNVRCFHKRQLCAVNNTVEFDVVFTTKQTFFGKYYVQSLVARFEHAVVDVNHGFDFFDGVAVCAALGYDLPDLILQVVALAVD